MPSISELSVVVPHQLLAIFWSLLVPVARSLYDSHGTSLTPVGTVLTGMNTHDSSGETLIVAVGVSFLRDCEFKTRSKVFVTG